MQRQNDGPPEPGDRELEWVQVEDSDDDDGGGRGRRRLSALAVLLALLTVTGTGLFSGGALAVSASFTASDVSVTANNGQLQSLTVAPTGNVTYDGLENPPSEIELTVQVKVDGSWENVTTKTVSVSSPGLEGNASYDVSQVDLLANSGLQKTDFKATPAEGSVDTNVEMRMHATLVGAGASGGDVVVTGSDTFTVTVTNQPAKGGVRGNANTGATGQ
jgi:hypothetical protein